ncbi:uncharacterized protein LOC108674211, partial [Hyalella azteca]|uniref:Uncharacterized protein LOC108674211 n=1 Tax=Hyalella azteca TaxID=294128 RepID=A0A8B7NV86_HYAAZ
VPSYDFQYVVFNAPDAQLFGASEKRDGDFTSGSYFVDLPDGRRQKVAYYVTPESGYVANVTYEDPNNVPVYAGDGTHEDGTISAQTSLGDEHFRIKGGHEIETGNVFRHNLIKEKEIKNPHSILTNSNSRYSKTSEFTKTFPLLAEDRRYTTNKSFSSLKKFTRPIARRPLLVSGKSTVDEVLLPQRSSDKKRHLFPIQPLNEQTQSPSSDSQSNIFDYASFVKSRRPEDLNAANAKQVERKRTKIVDNSPYLRTTPSNVAHMAKTTGNIASKSKSFKHTSVSQPNSGYVYSTSEVKPTPIIPPSTIMQPPKPLFPPKPLSGELAFLTAFNASTEGSLPLPVITSGTKVQPLTPSVEKTRIQEPYMRADENYRTLSSRYVSENQPPAAATNEFAFNGNGLGIQPRVAKPTPVREPFVWNKNGNFGIRLPSSGASQLSKTATSSSGSFGITFPLSQVTGERDAPADIGAQLSLLTRTSSRRENTKEKPKLKVEAPSIIMLPPGATIPLADRDINSRVNPTVIDTRSVFNTHEDTETPKGGISLQRATAKAAPLNVQPAFNTQLKFNAETTFEAQPRSNTREVVGGRSLGIYFPRVTSVGSFNTQPTSNSQPTFKTQATFNSQPTLNIQPSHHRNIGASLGGVPLPGQWTEDGHRITDIKQQFNGHREQNHDYRQRHHDQNNRQQTDSNRQPNYNRLPTGEDNRRGLVVQKLEPVLRLLLPTDSSVPIALHGLQAIERRNFDSKSCRGDGQPSGEVMTRMDDGAVSDLDESVFRRDDHTQGTRFGFNVLAS